MAATTRTPWRPMPSPRSREAARTEAPPTQRALDPLQAAPAQLGHAAPDEEPGQDVEAGVDPHGRADADRVDHRQQRQRDEEVGAPERGGLQARAGTAYRQRVDLGAGQPAHELQAAGVEEHEHDEAGDDEPGAAAAAVA